MFNVKIVESSNLEDLQEKINSSLGDEDGHDVVDIKYVVEQETEFSGYNVSAMIIYKK